MSIQREKQKDLPKRLGMSLIPHNNWTKAFLHQLFQTMGNDYWSVVQNLSQVMSRRIKKITCQWMNHCSTASENATTRLQSSAMFVCFFLEFRPKTVANRGTSMCGTNAGPLHHAPRRHGAMGVNNTLCAQSSVDHLGTDDPGNRRNQNMAGRPWLQTEAPAERRSRRAQKATYSELKKKISQKKIRCAHSSRGDGVMKEHHKCTRSDQTAETIVTIWNHKLNEILVEQRLTAMT